MSTMPIQQHVAWNKSHRIVRFESVTIKSGGYGDAASTNDGDLIESALKKTEFVSSIDFIDAVFNSSSIHESRFTDGSYGVWYAGKTEETALRERFHHFRDQISKNEATKYIPSSSEFITLLSSVNCPLHYVNGDLGELDPNSYNVSQQVGKSLYDADSNGVIWASVRHPGGECIGLFKRKLVMSITYGTKFTFEWDGNGKALARDLQTRQIILQI